MTLLCTGVGSLPHTDPDEARRFVAATADVTYLPQLPNRDAQESMLVQWGAGMAQVGQHGRNLAVGYPEGDRSQAFAGAATTLRGFSGRTLKTQATGPVTLAAAMRAGGVDGEGLLEDVADQLLLRIEEHLAWIRREVTVDELILVLDEPSLVVLGEAGAVLPDPVRAVLRRLIDSVDAQVGIHCCGDTDWGGVAELRPDWLSWDLGGLGMGFADGVDRIAECLGAGSRVMWGLVPVTPGPLPDQNVVVGRYGTAVANLVVAGAPIESLRSEAWFTPACGLAGLPCSDAEAVAEFLREVVEEVENGW